jgi:hypothetical protein
MLRTRRRLALLVGSVLTALLAVGAAAMALGRTPPPADWNVTPAVRGLDAGKLGNRAREALDAAGAGHDVAVVGDRAGIRFYVGEGTEGQRCYVSGRATDAEAEFGMIACLDRSPSAFPSEAQPILDFSAYRGEPAPSTRLFVQWLAGFAANGVGSVGVVTAEGETVTARVSNNVYASRNVPSGPVVKVVALGRDGSILWSRPLGGPAPPPVS